MKTVNSISKVLFVVACLSAGFGWQSLAMAAPESSTVETQQVVGKVAVNTATAEELASGLIGIGPIKAEALVAYRETHGPFTSLEQLLEVKGIGQAILDKNAERITL